MPLGSWDIIVSFSSSGKLGVAKIFNNYKREISFPLVFRAGNENIVELKVAA